MRNILVSHSEIWPNDGTLLLYSGKPEEVGSSGASVILSKENQKSLFGWKPLILNGSNLKKN